MACRAPRQAILAVEGVDEAEVYSKLAVWVLLRPQATNVVNGEKWFPFGVYRIYWNGAAEPGEFDGLLLSPDERSRGETAGRSRKRSSKRTPFTPRAR